MVVTIHVLSVHGSDSSCTVSHTSDSSCIVSHGSDSSCTVSQWWVLNVNAPSPHGYDSSCILYYYLLDGH